MKQTTQPFPGLSDFTDADAKPVAPKFITFTLPAQQNEFVEFAQNCRDALGRKGWRQWRNPSRNVAKMTFNLSPPSWGRPVTEAEWPTSQRKVTVAIEPGAECSLPEVWSSAIVVIQGGEIRGGMCPFLRPLNVRPIPLADGLEMPRPFDDGPKAA